MPQQVRNIAVHPQQEIPQPITQLTMDEKVEKAKEEVATKKTRVSFCSYMLLVVGSLGMVNALY
jgi:hypothetical protein